MLCHCEFDKETKPEWYYFEYGAVLIKCSVYLLSLVDGAICAGTKMSEIETKQKNYLFLTNTNEKVFMHHLSN